MTTLSVEALGSTQAWERTFKTQKSRIRPKSRKAKTTQRYKYPLEMAVFAMLIAVPVMLAAWIAVMWWVAGWAATAALVTPILLIAAPAGFVVRKQYVTWTRLRRGCLVLLEARPTNNGCGSKKLEAYPYPYKKTAPSRDEYGIVQWPRPGQPPLRATTILCQYALTLFDKLLKKDDPEIRSDFLNHADALIDGQTRGGHNDGCWVQTHGQAYYAPHEETWLCSMVQGQAISVLLRAHQLTGDRKYMEAAQRAMQPFEKTVMEGGVRTEYPDGKVFFEEYCLAPFYSHTLNGLIFTLFGLEEMARVGGNERARYWFERGIETLARPGVLEKYDLGYISTYDLLKRRLPSMDYHRIHICQLMALYDMTGREIFRQTAQRWLSYTESRSGRIRIFVHMLANKMLTGVTARKVAATAPAREHEPVREPAKAASPTTVPALAAG